jgi:STE24 endopeptidase
MQAYLAEKTRFGIIASIFSGAGILIFLFGGVLDRYNSWVVSLGLPFVAAGWLFLVLLYLASEVLSVPFTLYSVFRIENKYGFNTMTFSLWCADFFKSMTLSVLLLSVVAFAALWLVQRSPGLWWFWMWCFSLAFTLFVTYISPYVIEPLFNKFTPIEDPSLRDRIVRLASRAGINVGKVLKMDESKRSRHTNAYFTGIGRTKRIVLFDTLLRSMGTDEILAVLAHEIGHWKRWHLVKGLAVTEALSLIVLFAAYQLVQGDLLTDLFGLGDNTFYAKMVLAGFLLSIVLFPIRPAINGFTRKLEREADRFSCDLMPLPFTEGQPPQTGAPTLVGRMEKATQAPIMEGKGETMVQVLIKLSRDNLSNLFPHPLYAWFHYSHPPVLERIRYIREYCGKSGARNNG